jgi:hypothetical protein
MLSVSDKPVTLGVIMLNVIMPNVIMLNVIMLNVIMLNVIMLNVVAPVKHPHLLDMILWPQMVRYLYYFSLVLQTVVTRVVYN